MPNEIKMVMIVILATINSGFTISLFAEKNKKCRIVRYTFLYSALAIYMGIVSLITRDYYIKLFSVSLIDVCTSFAIFISFFYCIRTTRQQKSKLLNTLLIILLVGLAADVLATFFLIFKDVIGNFKFGALALPNNIDYVRACHIIHKGVCHCGMFMVLLSLVLKCFKTPMIYCYAYYKIIIFMIFINYLVSSIQKMWNVSSLGLKALAYSIIIIYLYWIIFYYSEKKRDDNVKSLAVSQYNQPLFIFDYKGKLIVMNSYAKMLLEIVNKKDQNDNNQNDDYYEYGFRDFIRDCNIDIDENMMDSDLRFNWLYRKDNIEFSYRIDQNILRNKKSVMIGKTVILSEQSADVDELTGFHNKEAFIKMYENKYIKLKYPITVMGFCIKQLGNIEEKYGEDIKNKLIQFVAALLVSECSKDSYFVRSDDSEFIVISFNTEINYANTVINNINDSIKSNKVFDFEVGLFTGYSMINDSQQNIINIASKVSSIIETKKIADYDSESASIFVSLIQMQKDEDPYFSEHIRRTRILCELLGKKLGLDEITQAKLNFLCMIHDIGNIGIPMEIVNKPGRLTEDEWRIMKTHVEKGYRITASSSEFKELAVCVKHHHENYDGTGYPDGLMGESIPYLSRIIIIAGSYDAMTNERPYRAPMSPMAAREELKKNSGKQYDPNIVKVFIELLDEIAPLDMEEERRVNKYELKIKPMSLEYNKDSSDSSIECVEHSTYVLNEKDLIIEVDDDFEKITGYSRYYVEETHMTQKDLIFPVDFDDYNERYTKFIDNNNEIYIEHRIRCRDNSEKFVFTYGRRYFDPVAKAGRTSLVITDLSQSKRINKKKFIKESQETDIFEAKNSNSFTVDIANSYVDSIKAVNFITKARFDEYNERLFANDKENYLLAIVDIDNFADFANSNVVNENNAIINYVASCIIEMMENNGIVCQIAADRFCCTINMLEESSVEEAKSKLAEIWGILSESISANGKNLTVSIGACFAKCGNRDYDRIFRKANEAMNIVKKSGKNGYKFIE